MPGVLIWAHIQVVEEVGGAGESVDLVFLAEAAGMHLIVQLIQLVS